MTIDDAVTLIRSHGFVAMIRPDLGGGADCIFAAKQTVLQSCLRVLEPTRRIVREGSGWTTLEGIGQAHGTFIPATVVRQRFATLDEAVAAVLSALESAP